MARGWKRLPSGLAYFGTIRDGDTVLDGPPAPAGPSGGVELPAKNAKKDVWVHAALNLGLEPGGLTKDEVIALVEEHVQASEDGGPVVGEVAGVDLPADPEEPGAGPGHDGDGTE